MTTYSSNATTGTREIGRGDGSIADPTQWSWQDLAHCTTRPELFFGPEWESDPDRDVREQAAIQVCSTCPVAYDCLKYALTRPEKHGVWGATTPEHRERLRRRRQRKRLASRSPGKPQDVPTVGDSRILQGLAAKGYSITCVRSWTRLSRDLLIKVRSGQKRSWSASNSRKLRSVLPELLKHHPLVPGAVRANALIQGWVPLDAWQWDQIDDPDAQPLQNAA